MVHLIVFGLPVIFGIMSSPRNDCVTAKGVVLRRLSTTYGFDSLDNKCATAPDRRANRLRRRSRLA